MGKNSDSSLCPYHKPRAMEAAVSRLFSTNRSKNNDLKLKQIIQHNSNLFQ